MKTCTLYLLSWWMIGNHLEKMEILGEVLYSFSCTTSSTSHILTNTGFPSTPPEYKTSLAFVIKVFSDAPCDYKCSLVDFLYFNVYFNDNQRCKKVPALHGMRPDNFGYQPRCIFCKEVVNVSVLWLESTDCRLMNSWFVCFFPSKLKNNCICNCGNGAGETRGMWAEIKERKRREGGRELLSNHIRELGWIGSVQLNEKLHHRLVPGSEMIDQKEKQR